MQHGVVAGVDDGGDLLGRHDVLEAAQEAGGADATGDDGDRDLS